MNTSELLPSRNSSAGGEEEEVDRYPGSREGAKARLVQRDPRGDIASYPTHGNEGGQQVASRRAAGHGERRGAGMLWGGQRH